MVSGDPPRRPARHLRRPPRPPSTPFPPVRAAVWAARLDDAEHRDPASFTHNGWVVEALQAAWSAITRTPIPDDDPSQGIFAAQHLQHALEAAVRGGRDTDTVAAIAGGLLGARWGASAVPVAWQRKLHGWPGLRSRDLVRLGIHTIRAGHNDPTGWPGGPVVRYGNWGNSDVLVQHPHDDGVWLSGEDHADHPPEGVDAVVSLSRRTATQVPIPGVAASDHVEVWLIDSPDDERQPEPSLRAAPGCRSGARPARRRQDSAPALRRSRQPHPNRGGAVLLTHHRPDSGAGARRDPQPSCPMPHPISGSATPSMSGAQTYRERPVRPGRQEPHLTRPDA